MGSAIPDLSQSGPGGADQREASGAQPPARAGRACWQCPRCHAELFLPDASTTRDCSYCGLRYAGFTQSAPSYAPEPAPLGALAESATCFFHPENAAAAVCSCGRYLCSLCTLTVDGSTVCPACFELARQRQTLASLRQKDTLYDSMALAAGLAWIVVYPSWIVAAPAVAYWTIAKWKAPRGYLIPRTPWRYPVAAVGVLWAPTLIAAIMLMARLTRP